MFTATLALTCAFAACTGALDGSSAPRDDDPEGGAGKGPALGGNGNTGPGPASEPPPDCRLQNPAPLRRLSHTEWAATVRDLFAGIGDPGPDRFSRAALPADWTQLTADPDDAGFRNRADRLNPTELLIADYADAAKSVAAKAMAGAREFLPCQQATAACGQAFIDAFGRRVWRRPLEPAERQRVAAFFTRQFDRAGFDVAVQLTLELFLQSPRFLYRLELGEPGADLDAYAVASRLSYLLWSSGPDEALLEAAAHGELDDEDGRRRQARRLIEDPRFRFMVSDFHSQWLRFDRVWLEDQRDDSIYPDVPENLRALFVKEAERFVSFVVDEHGGDPRALFESPVSFVDATLARFYGVEAPAEPWGRVELPGSERAGYLTRGLFNWSFAHARTSSPPLRGAFVIRNVMCAEVPPPPPDVNATPPEPKAATTTRELFEANAAAGACKACHHMIDGIGFAFENYDATGGFRAEENGRAVDSSGTIAVDSDVDGAFSDGLELNRRLASSAAVRGCVAGKWLDYALGRTRDDAERCMGDWLADVLASSDGSLGVMLTAFVGRPEFVAR